MVRLRAVLLMCCCCAWACGEPPRDDETPVVPSPTGCAMGERETADGSCVAAGVELCSAGFELVEAGECAAILPTEPCPAGTIAVPGDVSCRPLADCGSTKWGSTPVDAGTLYVDASYPGADSDGSESKPFTNIAAAVAAAPSEGIVAIAAGQYLEDVAVFGKRLELWGRCPEQVTVVGTGNAIATILMSGGGEVHGLAISGAGLGVFVPQGLVTVEDTWIHDTSGRGIEIQNAPIGTSVIRNVLIENAGEIGIHIGDSQVSVEKVAVRDTRLALGSGRALNVEDYLTGPQRSVVSVQGSFFAGSIDTGITLWGSEGVVTDTVVSGVTDASLGRAIGISVEDSDVGVAGELTLSGSRVEHVFGTGVFVWGSTAAIDNTVVSDGWLSPNLTVGGTRGVGIQQNQLTLMPASATVRSSLVQRFGELGLFVAAAHVRAESLWVRDMHGDQRPDLLGAGASAQLNPDTGAPARLELIDSVVERSLSVGAVAASAELLVEHSRVSDTRPRGDGLLGDGVSAVGTFGAATAEIRGAALLNNARAGAAAFGSTVVVANMIATCNSIDLVTEMDAGRESSLIDEGGNRCGCGAEHACQAQSSNLAPPPAVATE